MNGDSTASLLREAGIKSEIIVWREMLCDGPAVSDPSEDDFWQCRIDYFQTLKIPESEYVDKSRDEILKIKAIPSEAEIHLWFEHDLFCFVNLSCLLHYLKTMGRTTGINFHCPEKGSPVDGYLSLGDYSPNTIFQVEQQLLSEKKIDAAASWWEAYVAGDEERLRDSSMKSGGFMPIAFTVHGFRIPVDGLSIIEIEIITFLIDGPRSHTALLEHLLHWQKDQHYGFGDMQYRHRIERLIGTFLKRDGEMLSRSGDEEGKLEALQFGGFRSS